MSYKRLYISDTNFSEGATVEGIARSALSEAYAVLIDMIFKRSKFQLHTSNGFGWAFDQKSLEKKKKKKKKNFTKTI